MPNYRKEASPEEQKITRILDGLYPRARSKTVVEYEGQRYQIRYFPLEKAESKVKEWGHRWVLI